MAERNGRERDARREKNSKQLIFRRTVFLMIMFGICLLIGGLFLFYRIRLAEFWLMDHPGHGALAALLSSRKLMRGSWKGMLKIELR